MVNWHFGEVPIKMIGSATSAPFLLVLPTLLQSVSEKGAADWTHHIKSMAKRQNISVSSLLFQSLLNKYQIIIKPHYCTFGSFSGTFVCCADDDVWRHIVRCGLERLALQRLILRHWIHPTFQGQHMVIAFIITTIIVITVIIIVIIIQPIIIIILSV